MKSPVLLTVIASALALVPACTPADRSWVEEEGKGADAQGSLPAREGYRAQLHRTPWALDRISKDGSVVWIRTAVSGCNQFHHVRVRQVPGGFRLVAFDVVYTPTRRTTGACCISSGLDIASSFRVLLVATEILGECVPGDPREMCALLHAVAGLRKGEPERDPWLG